MATSSRGFWCSIRSRRHRPTDAFAMLNWNIFIDPGYRYATRGLIARSKIVDYSFPGCRYAFCVANAETWLAMVPLGGFFFQEAVDVDHVWDEHFWFLNVSSTRSRAILGTCGLAIMKNMLCRASSFFFRRTRPVQLGRLPGLLPT